MNSRLFSIKIINWYKKTDVSLPWRNIKDPYKIWLSEIMLQQTRVSTVIPYYNKWIQSFPNIKSVSDSSIDSLLKHWEGLGYYNRVKNFHNACKALVKNNNGMVPNDKKIFLQLPGVGDYINAAVLSMAFNIPLPAIDTNAVRVFSRIFQISDTYTKSQKIISSKIKNLIDIQFPGDFNQSIMDLGRLICKPSTPNCNECPVNMFCSAYVNNLVDKYPKKKIKKLKPHYKIAVGIIWKKNVFLISKRLNNKMLGGLWELPGGKIKNLESPARCVVRETKEELDIHVKTVSFLGQILHEYSHFSISLYAFSCKYLAGSPKTIGCDDWRWINASEINNFSFPRASHKIFNLIGIGFK